MLEVILFWSVFFWACLYLLFEALEKLMGRRAFYRKVYLFTPSWRFSRKVIFFWKGRKCSRCGSTRFLDVHHTTYAHLWWEWLFFWEMDVLCRSCHISEHSKAGN